jgi:metal-responsive CopG/Arc/MetJ family transcriptional regulator
MKRRRRPGVLDVVVVRRRWEPRSHAVALAVAEELVLEQRWLVTKNREHVGVVDDVVVQAIAHAAAHAA